MRRTDDPKNYGAKCRVCPFARNGSAARPVFGERSSAAVGVLLGESPGRDEEESGKPFVGATGRALDSELLKVKLKRSELHVLNAIACRPLVSDKSEASMKKAADCCSKLFKHQYRGMEKLPVFAMGTWAVYALNKKKWALQNRRGFIHELKNTKYIPSWHPTYALFRNPYERGAFQIDLDRFSRLIRGRLEKFPKKLFLNPSVADVRRLVAAGEPIAFDIETAPESPELGHTGKDPLRARLKSVALGNTKWALARWWRGDGSAVEREIKSVLENPRVLKVGHNAIWFDNRVLARYGIEVQNFADTRDLRRAQVSTSRLSLSYLTSLFTDFTPWKLTGDEK